MAFAVPRVHRWLYVTGAALIVVGLVVLAFAVSSDEAAGPRGLTAALLLVGGLFVIWCGMRLRGTVDRVQESIDRVAGPATRFEAPADLQEIIETLASAGLNFDPELFRNAQVTTHVQTIDAGDGATDDAEFRRHARAATATVDAFHPFMQLGAETVAAVTLQVSLDGGPPYAVTVNGLVPQTVAARLTPGMRVPVLVDPEVHERVLVDWARV